MFTLNHKSNKSNARTGTLETAHGNIETPFFMPIATKGAIKNLSTQDMHELNAQIILSNTYHLYLQPGEELIKEAGGLHSFMQWEKPILTDSGGYQVFSLAGNKGQGDNLVKLSEEGVEFQSHLDGSKHFITPESAVQIQTDLGVDMMMCLDNCPEGNAPYEEVEKAVDLTYRWAQRCKAKYDELIKAGENTPKLFGIIQGSVFEDLRKKSLEQITSLNFDGIAIGGLAVGEDREDMFRILRVIAPQMPENLPRYLMGLGRPEDIVEAVKNGVDMFDCVIPTREARHGRLYFFHPEIQDLHDNFYTQEIITNAKYKEDFSPINPGSKIGLLRDYSKAYLHHLLKTNEGLGFRLATLNNLEFYFTLMKRIRERIEEGEL